MKFMGILLTESRKEDLRKKYASKFNDGDLNWILNISDLEDFNHKYTDFVLKNLNPKSEDLDMDVSTAVEIVKEFDKYQSKLEKRDINQYKSLRELDTLLEIIIDEEKAKQLEKDLEKQVDRIYEDDKFLVVRPKTEEASCKYGANTKWCTTSKGSGNFERYTSGLQGLYYVIDKKNSTDKNYSKIAIHFNPNGGITYWDSNDTPMDRRESQLFNYAFPELIDTIKNDFEKITKSGLVEFLDEVFNSNTVASRKDTRYLGTENILKVNVDGFQTIKDLGPGHAVGELSINFNDKLIDSYQIFIAFKPIDKKTFSASIGFMGSDDYVETSNFIDLGLEGWGFDSKYLLTGGLAQNTAESLANHVASRVMDYIKDNQELQQKVVGSARVWRPNLGYGYTFGKNKGLIKKLVDWLDSGNEGTRLDFLEHLGTVEKVMKDGKVFYKRPNRSHLYKPTDLRGQYSSFFASAVLAGILKNVKKGKNYILTKGPNFEAFKSGELRAL